MLSKKHVEDVCLSPSVGQTDSNTCRYLAFAEEGFKTTCHCLKKSPQKKADIDAAVNKYLADCKRDKIDPTSEGVPLGNHCSGFPIFKHIEQGYDVKP